MKKVSKIFLSITVSIVVVLAVANGMYFILSHSTIGTVLFHSLYMKVVHSQEAHAHAFASKCGAVTAYYPEITDEWRRNCRNRCMELTVNSKDQAMMTACRSGCAFMIEKVGESCL